MKKPTLVITKRAGSIPIQGKCSSCPEVEFCTEGKIGTPAEHLNALSEEFKLHFADVHMREDASQAAARIVRERQRSTRPLYQAMLVVLAISP